MMKKFKWLFLGLLLLCFAYIAYLVLNDKSQDFDNFIYGLVTFNKGDFWTGFYKFITCFASEIMIIAISLMFLVLFKKKRYALFIFLNALNILFLNVLLKLIFMRDRPYELMIITESGYSFPSGHAMAALGFYGFIIYLIFHFNLEKRAKICFTALTILLIFLIGVSRIYLGVHYASDILAGYIVSLIYLIFYVSFIKKYLGFENEVKYD